ncbi:MAG: hypothetical protein LBK63_05810 [Treponema sp.]|jgi:hypothetical protein|nr:hypothetical protein [Treponema sp.]
MKRNFLVIAGVLVILGGTVFSQEVEIGRGKLVFGGRVATGVYFDINSTNNKDGTFQILNMGYPDNDYNNSMRAELSAVYTNRNGGFRLGLRADDVINRLEGGEGLFNVPYANGWVDLLDNKLRVTGGKVADNVWGTIGFLDSTIPAAGLRLEAKPFEGLNAGVFFTVPEKKEIASSASPPTTSVIAASPTQILWETIFGVRYAGPSFWASALIQLDSDYDSAPMGSFDSVNHPVNFKDDQEIRAIAGVGFSGIPKLNLIAEADIWGLGVLSDQGRIDLRETAAYSINDKFKVELRAQELLWLYNDELKPWLEFKPLFTYRANSIVTTVLETGFGLGNYGEAELVTPQMGAVPNGPKTIYQIYAKPTALLTLDGGLAVKTWYKFTISEKEDQDSATANQAAIEFAWSF